MPVAANHQHIDMPDLVPSLLAKHSLISDQVSEPQIATILHELDKVLARGTAGDIVEFGCYIGTTSLFIRRLLDARGQSSPRTFHVYDSFAGLPPKSTKDASAAGESFTAGELAASKKQFLREFQKAGLRPPVIHKGWFAGLRANDVPNDIAFAFLDGDFYESIRDSLRLVLPRMQKGSTIVIDDYSREALPGVARAVHEHINPQTITTTHNLAIIHL